MGRADPHHLCGRVVGVSEISLCRARRRGRKRGTYTKVICDILQSSLERLASAHHELDVVAVGKPRPETLEEDVFRCRQRHGRQQLDQVTEIIATVRGKRQGDDERRAPTRETVVIEPGDTRGASTRTCETRSTLRLE